MSASSSFTSQTEIATARVQPGRIHVFRRLEASRLTLVVAGEADLSNAAELRDLLVEASRGGSTDTVVDLADLSFCDLSGLDALRQGAQAAGRDGVVMTFRGMSPQLRWLDGNFPVRVPTHRPTR